VFPCFLVKVKVFICLPTPKNMVYEVEFGLRVKDANVLRKKIKSLGGELVKEERKVSIYYHIPEDLKSCVRLDLRKDSSVLVYKEGELTLPSKKEFKTNVSNPKMLHETFSKLGFDKPLVKKRHSRHYVLNGISVAIRDDDGEINAEIEKVVHTEGEVSDAEKEIRNVMALLGFSDADRFTTQDIKERVARHTRQASGKFSFDDAYRFLEE